jgi:DNA-binding XRE family transcriptional regulator
MAIGLIPKIIKTKRMSLAWSGETLEKLSGVNRNIIYGIENGKISSVKNCWLLVEALGIGFNAKLFSEQVKVFRKKTKLSTQKLAQLANVSVSTINLIESNTKTPTAKICYSVAKALNLNLEDFITNSS